MRAFLADFPALSSQRCHGIVTAPGFDPDRYRMLNPDVSSSGQDPFAHYVAYGKREGRQTG